MKKHKRKIHIEKDIWFYWINCGRWGEATYVTICSPMKNFYKVNANVIVESKMYIGVEGYLPTQIKPSNIKEYIINAKIQ